jgi:hypothetical protein
MQAGGCRSCGESSSESGLSQHVREEDLSNGNANINGKGGGKAVHSLKHVLLSEHLKSSRHKGTKPGQL